MGRLIQRNHLPFISLIIASFLFSPISQNLGQTLGLNDYKTSGEGSDQGWLFADSDSDGLDNGNDSCPFWYENNCSLKFNDSNTLYSKVFDLENDTVVDVEYSPDGRFIAFSSRDSDLAYVIDSVSYHLVKSISTSDLGRDVESVKFSNDGEIFALISDDGLFLYETSSWSLIQKGLEDVFTPYIMYGADIVFSPDDRYVAIAVNQGYNNGSAYIWDRFIGSTVREINIQSNGIDYEKLAAIDYSNDGKFLALARGNQFAVFETEDWTIVHSHTNRNLSQNDCERFSGGCANYVRDLEFSNDGIFLAVGNFNSSIEIYRTNLLTCFACDSWEIWNELSIYVEDSFELEGITISPDSSQIISLWEDVYEPGTQYVSASIKVQNLVTRYIEKYEIHGESLLWDIAVSPDGNSIALSDNDNWNSGGYYEGPDGLGLFTLTIDSDSDGIHDSKDACDDTTPGAFVNNIGCDFIPGPSVSSDNYYSEYTFDWVILSNFVLWFFIAYKFLKINGKKLSNIPWVLPLFFALILTYGVFQIPGYRDEIRPSGEYFYCQDGTMVSYDEALSSGLKASEFEDNPPDHWCSDAVSWVSELSWGGWSLYLLNIFTVSIALIISVIVYNRQNSNFVSNLVKGAYSGAKKQVKKIHKQHKQNRKQKKQLKKIQTNQLNKSQSSNSNNNGLQWLSSQGQQNFENFSKSKKSSQKSKKPKLKTGGKSSQSPNSDNLQASKENSNLDKPEINRREDWMTDYRVDDDNVEWGEDQNGTWWYRDPGATDWSEWSDYDLTPKYQPKEKKVEPNIIQQKLPVADLTMPLNSEPVIQENTRTVTVDSKGVTTIETGFSIVTLDKLTDEVTKIPRSVEQHQMFIQEIQNMVNLEAKGYDVGLIDYDKGNNPRIVTRYMGPSKLSEHYKTISLRGKKSIIEDLIENVAKIHKCGMVHRDLKPDNILVDARPRNNNHQFDAIIDYGIAMKINRRQSETYNTAGTKFFGHSSQKDPDFKASIGQDWFALARIFALIIRGVSIDSLDAEIQMSQTGLIMDSSISTLGFDESVVQSISELIVLATDPNCEDNATIGKLAKVGKALSKKF